MVKLLKSQSNSQPNRLNLFMKIITILLNKTLVLISRNDALP